LVATLGPDKPEVTNTGKADPVTPVRRCVHCRAVLARWNQSADNICFACWESASAVAA
jgi:hypothetical protein